MGLKYNWILPEYDDNIVKLFTEQYNIPRITSKILSARNINDYKQVKEILTGDYEEGYNPYLIYDMENAVSRINIAIENEEKILVYGDYDADGITSTVLMLETLASLGANVSAYIPNRFTEGYGPNKEAFKTIIESGISLIITVDNGIAAVEEVDYANELGCDVIITDHHQIQDEIPKAYAIIHPEHPNGNYPFGKLSGVGVAFKLSHALLDVYPDFFLDLVAIGTIADLVPMVSENRIFVKQGLNLLNEDTRLGIKLLLNIAGHSGNIDEQTIGFTIAPRLNAIGRIASAKEGLQFLSTDDLEEAQFLAQKIDNYNSERKNITEQIVSRIDNLISDKSDKNVLVLAEEDFHEGVLGIVASNIVEKYKKPALVMNIDGDKVKGSARSIFTFNIYNAMSRINHLFTAFGGHDMAAGFSTTLKNLKEIEDRLDILYGEYLSNTKHLKLDKYIDLVISYEEVSYELLKNIEVLKPFGTNFEKPILLLENVLILEKIEFGSNNQYLKLIVGNNTDKLECISFRDNECYDSIEIGDTIDLLCYLDKNNFNGRTRLQINLLDVEKKEFLFTDYRKCNINFNNLPISELKLSKNYEDHHNNYYKFSDLHKIKNKFDIINIIDIPSSIKQIENVVNLGAKNIKLICSEKNELRKIYKINKEKLIKLFNILLKIKVLELNNIKNIEQIVKLINTNIDSLKIMFKIFLELNLIKIEKNVITVNKNYEIINLENSITYKNMQERFYLEELFLDGDIQTINKILNKNI